jgi:hypothetical protein
MTRIFEIKDYKKDYGYGRFCTVIDEDRPTVDVVRKGTNDPKEVRAAFEKFMKGKE